MYFETVNNFFFLYGEQKLLFGCPKLAGWAQNCAVVKQTLLRISISIDSLCLPQQLTYQYQKLMPYT